MDSTKKAFIISATLHILLLLPALRTGGGFKLKDVDRRKNKNPIVEAFVPKEAEPVAVDIVRIGDKKVKTSKPQECHKSYIGIGITIDDISNVISEVAKGYAADRAGIKPNSLLVFPPSNDLTGEEGTQVKVTILTSKGSTIEYMLTREIICVK
jgi:C-terminal processing protease CtpA/Prc